MAKTRVRETKGKKILKKIQTIVEFFITLIVVITSIIIIVQRVSNNENSFSGFRIFKIETGSMIPKYNINDVILARETDAKNIKIGDDLVYKAEEGEMKGMIITHQVIGKEEKEGKIFFTTQGIANNSADPEFESEQAIGVVKCKLHVLTFMVNIFSNIYLFYFIIILPLTIYIFFKEIHGADRRERKREKEMLKKVDEPKLLTEKNTPRKRKKKNDKSTEESASKRKRI